mmetsp:Transcript_4286/g.12936  ORF Transcript_4286/g.12936 Transcript_4286/m.12936 type:complete len:82 (+) Transcript_4286:347-592(+)
MLCHKKPTRAIWRKSTGPYDTDDVQTRDEITAVGKSDAVASNTRKNRNLARLSVFSSGGNGTGSLACSSVFEAKIKATPTT